MSPVINKLIGDKSIATKLTILVCFFAVTLVSIVLYTVITLKTQESDSTGIDIAGRQRMLTQKYTKEIFDELNSHNMVIATQTQTTALSTQILADRAYYTSNVISKLQKDQMPVSVKPNFHQEIGAIPAPATFVQGVSAELANSNASYSYQLLSEYNINPDKGISDENSKQAWEQLKTNPGTPFSKVIKSENGGAVLYYAQADLAAPGCVSCHNSHPKSPKVDFVEGELMGILAVQALITNDQIIAESLVNPPKIKSADKTAKLFELSLASLKNGGVTYSDLAMKNEVMLPKPPNQAIKEKLEEVGGLWVQMTSSVEFLRASEDVTSDEYIKHLNLLRKLNIDILKTMNAAVGQFAAASSGNITQLIWGISIILVIALFLTAWVGYLVTKMIVKPLNDGIGVARKISGGDLSSQIDIVYQDETGQLLQTMQLD